MTAVVIYAFRSPGSGAVYVGKHECNPEGWPRRGNGRLPDGYDGSGVVVGHFHRRHGDRVQWRILAIVPVADWSRAERRAVDLTRAIFGRKCVNQKDGGDGFSSADVRRLWADPEYAAKVTFANKKRAATPEGRKQIERALAATNTPEAKAKRLAGLERWHTSPAGRAHLEAQIGRLHSDPELVARRNERLVSWNQSPEGVAVRNEALRKAHTDPEATAKRDAAIAAWKATPEGMAQMKATIARWNACPEYVAGRLARLDAMNRDPEFRARRAEALRALTATAEWQEAHRSRCASDASRATNSAAQRSAAQKPGRRSQLLLANQIRSRKQRAERRLKPFRSPPAFSHSGVTVWILHPRLPLGINGPSTTTNRRRGSTQPKL